MKTTLSLSKIGFFNPGRLSDQEIELSFIARKNLFDFLFKKISGEKKNSIPQHYLIIGQRGMGKSTLLSRIAAETRKVPHRKHFIPLAFPEEQYNVDRLSKFWLNCMDALADALDKEHNILHINALENEIDKLSENKASAQEIYIVLMQWAEKLERRIILLVDNLDLIFSKLNKEEQHQLRAILISKGAPILVGTSVSFIDDTLNYDAPFYDAFQVNYLKRLTPKETREVLLNLARITGSQNFGDLIDNEKARIQTIYQLTGGTPRTLALLFPLIRDGFSEELQNDLDALLDVITPLYKSRFEELAEQQQIIMDAIALNWDPMNLEQLREVTQLDNSTLSPQLKRLISIGWLQKLDAYKAKGGAYELTERFFNVWYIMRRSSRRQKRELYCLTKFLEAFYGSELQQLAQARISCTIDNLENVTLNLALADALSENELSENLRSKGYEALMELSRADGSILKNFSVPDEYIRKKVEDLYLNSNQHYEAGQHDEAKAELEKILSLDPRQAPAWNNIGVILRQHFREYEAAEKAFLNAIQIDEEFLFPIKSLATLWAKELKRPKDAESLLKKAIENNPEDDWLYNALGNIQIDSFNDALKAKSFFEQAIKIDSKKSNYWRNLGWVNSKFLMNYEEAVKDYMQAIALDEHDKIAWNSLGIIYTQNLKDFENAEKAFF